MANSSTAVIFNSLCNAMGVNPNLVVAAMIEKLKTLADQPKIKSPSQGVDNQSSTPTPTPTPSKGVVFGKPNV